MSLEKTVWRAVVRAIEGAIPEYDSVNERVSLGQARKTRNFAARQLELEKGMFVLDAGIGPGTMSEILFQEAPELTVIGLDVSTTLLGAARQRLKSRFGDRLGLVRAAFEALPFKDGCFQRIVSAYAFRDARDRSTAIHEFYRVSAVGGVFAIVDLGKPDTHLRRAMITFYIRYLVPIIARLSMSGTIQGNPWRMIFPTYEALATNQVLSSSLGVEFADVRIVEFASGGMIVVFASKR